ncbi:breast cancer type 2 susceptibility protein [Stylonychia lemnae]|uniref:Breast cancer type 2 susceptibility protein n=1 Tax=Stylonychia lemnae TaxID=5949 RepID=A0A078B3U8_STYLE|nr:breast cancer type 2 susceptibility protein [Stylonychia lemnae]|eukprot:CDW89220.1 breast cancer type 2 susceptibility protein [Stylonychia lemnae]
MPQQLKTNYNTMPFSNNNGGNSNKPNFYNNRMNFIGQQSQNFYPSQQNQNYRIINCNNGNYNQKNNYYNNNAQNNNGQNNKQQYDSIDSNLQQLMIKALFEKNNELASSHVEITKSMMDCFRIVGQIFSPIVDQQNQENLQLKRLISQRLGIDADDRIIMQQIQQSQSNKRPRAEFINNQIIRNYHSQESHRDEVNPNNNFSNFKHSFSNIQQLQVKRTSNNMQNMQTQNSILEKVANQQKLFGEGIFNGNANHHLDIHQQQIIRQTSNNNSFLGAVMNETNSNEDIAFFKGNQKMSINEDSLRKGQQFLQKDLFYDSDLDFDPEAILQKSKYQVETFKQLHHQHKQQLVGNIKILRTRGLIRIKRVALHFQEKIEQMKLYISQYTFLACSQSSSDSEFSDDQRNTQEDTEFQYSQLIQLQEKMHYLEMKAKAFENYQYKTFSQEINDISTTYLLQNSKIVKISIEDSIIKQILGLEPAQSSSNVSFQDIDCKLEFERAKELRNFPFPQLNSDEKQQKYKIKNSTHSINMKFPCLCCLRQQQIYLENRSAKQIIIECEICQNQKYIGHFELHKILSTNLQGVVKSQEFDQYWTENQYSQIVWKLNAYQQFFKIQCLNFYNTLAALQQRMKKEFLQAKKSFFQKVIQKEASISSHSVLYIANIKKSKGKETQNSYILDICDGAYYMKCIVSEKVENFQCDRMILEMINNGQLKPGDKFHFFGIYLMNRPILEPLDQEPEVKSSHHYLQNKHNYHMKININGFLKAANDQIIGEQKQDPYFIRQIQHLIQSSKQIPCIDAIVVKKFQPYFLEEADFDDTNQKTKKKRVLRSNRSMERLKTIKITQIEEMLEREIQTKYSSRDYYLMSQSERQQLDDEIRQQREDKMRILNDKYKLCFRVKLVDSISFYYGQQHNQRQIIMTFLNSMEDIFQSIEVGQRYRFFNIKPDNMNFNGVKQVNRECLYLQFQKGKSKKESFEDIVRYQYQVLSSDIRNKLAKINEYSKSLIPKLNQPFELLQKIAQISKIYDQQRINNFKNCNEISFVGYLVRTFFKQQTQQDGIDSIESVIFLTSDLEIVCLSMHDHNFFLRTSIPNDQTIVICDGIIFQQIGKISLDDSSNNILGDQMIADSLQSYQNSLTSTAFSYREFYYLMCITNNTTSILTERERRTLQFQDEMNKMNRIMNSEAFKNKLKQIQMIIGSRESLGHVSNSDYDRSNNSNGNSSMRPFLANGTINTTSQFATGTLQNYKTLSPTNRFSMQIRSANNNNLSLGLQTKKTKTSFKGITGGGKLAESIARNQGSPKRAGSKEIQKFQSSQNDKKPQEEQQSESIMSEDEHQAMQKKINEKLSQQGVQDGVNSDIEEDIKSVRKPRSIKKLSEIQANNNSNFSNIYIDRRTRGAKKRHINNYQQNQPTHSLAQDDLEIELENEDEEQQLESQGMNDSNSEIFKFPFEVISIHSESPCKQDQLNCQNI